MRPDQPKFVSEKPFRRKKALGRISKTVVRVCKMFCDSFRAPISFVQSWQGGVAELGPGVIPGPSSKSLPTRLRRAVSRRGRYRAYHGP